MSFHLHCLYKLLIDFFYRKTFEAYGGDATFIITNKTLILRGFSISDDDGYKNDFSLNMKIL